MSTWVARHPVVRTSQVTAGTSRLIPVIDALPSTESAVPAALAEPPRHHAGGDHGPGAGEPERDEQAVDGGELPDVADHRGQHERDHQQHGADRGDGADAEAVERHARQRHEDAVEEEA
jgi:hypothetical protein